MISPTRISTPSLRRELISLVFVVSVVWLVKMARRLKAARALTMADVMCVPMPPVAPKMRMLDLAILWRKKDDVLTVDILLERVRVNPALRSSMTWINVHHHADMQYSALTLCR